jgi:hypothetical protein
MHGKLTYEYWHISLSFQTILGSNITVGSSTILFSRAVEFTVIVFYMVRVAEILQKEGHPKSDLFHNKYDFYAYTRW